MLLALPVAGHFTAREPDPGIVPEVLDAIRRRAPPLLALLFGAAGLEVSTPALPSHPLAALALALAVVLCARLDEAGAVAVAAVLVHKGLDPALAVALLAIGPFTRAGLLRASRRRLGWAALAWFVVGTLAWRTGALASAGALASSALDGVRNPIAAQAAASPIGSASALALIAIALETLWTAGVRGWFAPLRHGPRAA